MQQYTGKLVNFDGHGSIVQWVAQLAANNWQSVHGHMVYKPDTATLDLSDPEPMYMLPVSLGCPPPSGNMTVSSKITCHFLLLARGSSRGTHLRN